MKIKVQDVIDNWKYWISEKKLMEQDVYFELNNNKYELSGIGGHTKRISYIDKNKIFTIPISEVEYLIIENICGEV